MTILILATGIGLVWTPYATRIFEKGNAWLLNLSIEDEKMYKQIKTEDIVSQLLGLLLIICSFIMLIMNK